MRKLCSEHLTCNLFCCKQLIDKRCYLCGKNTHNAKLIVSTAIYFPFHEMLSLTNREVKHEQSSYFISTHYLQWKSNLSHLVLIMSNPCQHLLNHVLFPTHCAKKPVTTTLTYPWKCTVLHCNHLGNTWKPLVLMTRHFDYCPSASEGDNQRVRSSAPVVSRCFPGGYNVKLYFSRGRLAWWLLAFLCCDNTSVQTRQARKTIQLVSV